MGEAQVRLYFAAAMLAVGEQVNVNLVCAELGAPVPDFREIKGGSIVLGPANAQYLAPSVAVSAQQYVNGIRKFRATDKAEHGVHIPLPGCPSPELELLGRWLRQRDIVLM